MKYLRILVITLFFALSLEALPQKETLQSQTAAKKARTVLDSLVNSKVKHAEFREKFPGALLEVCNSTGPFHESKAFPIIEEAGKYIRSNNIFEPIELQAILLKEQTNQYNIYHEVVHEYRRLRNHQDPKSLRLRALAQQSTNMLNYMIAAGIIHYYSLNIKEARANFDKLMTIIPSDPMVIKYSRLLSDRDL